MLVPPKKLGWKCPNNLKNGTHATTTATAATTASGWHRRPDIEHGLRARNRHQQPGRSHDQVFAVVAFRHDAALHLGVRPERVRNEHDHERLEVGRIVEGLHRYFCRPLRRRQSSNWKSSKTFASPCRKQTTTASVSAGENLYPARNTRKSFKTFLTP